MLSEAIAGPAAWNAGTIDDPRQWYHALSDHALQLLDRSIARFRAGGAPIVGFRASDEPIWAARGELRAVLADLESGRGFALLTGIPLDRYSNDEQQLAYWLIGQLLGQPFAQNVQGTLLYDVRDTGQDVRYGARFSVTSSESTFHTDNCFGQEVLDYVGLYCLRGAKAGGVNQLVSVYSIHNELLRKDPAALSALYERYHMDRRGGVQAGESSTIEHPVLAWSGRELLCRYLRYWIEVGQDKAGMPLSAEQLRAFAAFDREAASQELHAEFLLRPGEMFFINNRWILHNRTAFEDYPEPERKRHLIRLWLRAVA